jgi:hypothetical protein
MKGFMKYAVDMLSCVIIYIPSFMKTDIGVQAVLRFASAICEAVMFVLSMSKIYEGRHSDGLLWHDIPTKFYEGWFRH